jgi:hypothetical protein
MAETDGTPMIAARLGRQMQLGHVVSDIDAALRYRTEIMGVGPFVMLDTSVGANRRFIHRGKPSPVEFSIAFSFVGNAMIELISPSNSAPSPYSEFFASGREGLHHVGFWPSDFEQTCGDLLRSGFTEVSSIESSDNTRIIYCDAPGPLGVMVELGPMTPERRAFYAAIKALADTWDGSRPVRRYADRAAFNASADAQT